LAERIQKALVRLKASHRHLPQSLLGQAIDYTLGQWPTLEIFLGDGRVEIDNNLVENAIRPTAIGKKNWLFIGEAQAGDRSAILYTIIECCRRRGLDPFTYLRDVFTVSDRWSASSSMGQRCQSIGAYDVDECEGRSSEAGCAWPCAGVGGAPRGVAG
jgi:hypothetical protein